MQRVVALKGGDSVEQPDEADSNAPEEEFLPNVNESIDAVDMSELTRSDDASQTDEKAEPEAIEDEELSEEEPNLPEPDKSASPKPDEVTAETKLVGTLDIPKEPFQISNFLERLSNAINKDLVDKCAMEFVAELNRKLNRKRLIQHILNVPTNRLDLLPFLSRFLATIKPSVPEVPMKIAHELLTKFRSIANKKYEPPKRGEKRRELIRIDVKVHLSSFISELVFFKACSHFKYICRSNLVFFRKPKRSHAYVPFWWI